MSYNLDLRLPKQTLGAAAFQFLPAEDSHNPFDVRQVVLLGGGVYENVVQVDLDKIINALTEQVGHHPLESARCIH
jgi:hypothetical protein